MPEIETTMSSATLLILYLAIRVRYDRLAAIGGDNRDGLTIVFIQGDGEGETVSFLDRMVTCLLAECRAKSEGVGGGVGGSIYPINPFKLDRKITVGGSRAAICSVNTGGGSH